MPQTVFRLIGPEELFKEAPFMGLYTEQKKGEGSRKICVHSGGKFKMFYCKPKGQVNPQFAMIFAS